MNRDDLLLWLLRDNPGATRAELVALATSRREAMADMLSVRAPRRGWGLLVAQLSPEQVGDWCVEQLDSPLVRTTRDSSGTDRYDITENGRQYLRGRGIN